jgi:hypothetical protein
LRAVLSRQTSTGILPGFSHYKDLSVVANSMDTIDMVHPKFGVLVVKTVTIDSEI